MKKLAMKMLSLLLVLSLLLPTCVFAQPGQDGDGTPGTQGAAMENADTPTGGGNSGENADTSTGGGNGDGNADENSDTSTGGENGDGDTKDVNGGSVTQSTTSEKTTTFTEGEDGDEDGDVSEEEAAPLNAEVIIDTGTYIPAPGTLADNDELFARYVQREFNRARYRGYARAPVYYASTHTKNTLNATERDIYDTLQVGIIQVADGTLASTEFTVTGGTYSSTLTGAVGEVWTESGGTATLTPMASATFSAEIGSNGTMVNTQKIMDCLLADCPYELYWFNKLKGMYTEIKYSLTSDPTTGDTAKVTGLVFKFTVAKEYLASGKIFETNTAPTSAAKSAATTALNIVNGIPAGSTDRDILKYFCDEICKRVSYNKPASEWEDSYTLDYYGNPWQMIWVFDGDDTSNVVCEGYAKAFQYLCELAKKNSKFKDSTLRCYSVTGKMGGGNHMWNVVEVGNARYLVDVTNCDEGMTGHPYGLFLKTGTIASGGAACTIGSITYTYDAKMSGLFCAGYPALRELQSIAITMPPSKTTYAQGENFDPAGMVVTATYSDGSAIPVTGYTVEGGSSLASGATSVTIKYAELDNVKQTTQTVTVTDKPALGGMVTITGASSPNPKIGDTLTANTGSLNYNGATAGTLSYQWKAGGADVGTGSTYTVKVGDYNKKITVTVTNSNNTGSVSSMATAAVVKKDGPHAPTGSIAVKNITAGGFTYTAIAGQQYAITTNNIAPGTDSSEWKTETAGDVVVTGKNANTEYYIYTRFAETDEAYAGAASGGTKVKTRMSAAASEFTYSTKEAVYTGSANGATVSSVAHSGKFALKYNGADTVPTNAGKYNLTAEVTAHDDYAATTVELGTWEIKPLEVTLTWSGHAARTYDGNNSNVTATVSNKKGTDVVNVTVTGGTEANAGSHTATANALTGAAASNYKLPSTKPTQPYTINAATITVGTDAFTDYTGVYDGNSHSIKVDTSKITTVNGQPITIKYGTTSSTYDLDAAPTATNVSESMTVHYKITAPNHKAVTGTATIKINKATQTISGGDFSVKVGKTVNLDEKFSAQGELTYSITGANTTGSSVSGKVLTVGATTGSFTLKVDAATTDNYEAANKTVTVTVTAKEVQTVTADDVSATYGDTNVKVVGSTNGDGAITYAVTGVAGVVEVDSNTGALTIKKAGTTSVTITAAETSDYAKATKSVTITVAQKDVTITGLGAANKVYDGSNSATVTGTAAVAGKVGSDDVTVTGGTATFNNKDVGAGKTVTFIGYTLSGTAAGNYNLTAQPASVTAEITAKEVTVTGITAANRAYEKDNLEVTLTSGTLYGVLIGDTVTIDLTPPARRENHCPKPSAWESRRRIPSCSTRLYRRTAATKPSPARTPPPPRLSMTAQIFPNGR